MEEFISIKDYVYIKKNELKEKIKNRNDINLVVVQVGDNPASNSYIKGKKKDCEEVGICFQLKKFDENISQKDFELEIFKLNLNIKTKGIIIQLPLPSHLNPENLICDEKDVDGFNKSSHFSPCTPLGVINWLKYNKIDFSGKNCVVIGRSNIVGKPLTNMLINEGATVTCCNSKTKDLSFYTKNADIVFSAVGKPKFLDENYFSKNCIIVDIGINRDESGKLCGDINYNNVVNKVKYITPVPGGVGLLTRLTLLENTY